MARKRASMRDGPLAELFRATEAAQRQEGDDEPVDEPLPPAADASRRYMAAATYVGNNPGPSQRIVFGWWPSEQEARSAAARILDTAPDASSDDYEIRVNRMQDPT